MKNANLNPRETVNFRNYAKIYTRASSQYLCNHCACIKRSRLCTLSRNYVLELLLVSLYSTYIMECKMSYMQDLIQAQQA